jgi:hypothetical protein
MVVGYPVAHQLGKKDKEESSGLSELFRFLIVVVALVSLTPTGMLSSESFQAWCAPGRFHGKDGCTPCQPGMFKSSWGSSMCSPCQAGKEIFVTHNPNHDAFLHGLY